MKLVTSALLVALLSSCSDARDVASAELAVTGAVKSQLRGYDLGPPFPAGLRDSGLVNGYAEGEWVPFVAVVEGKKLATADGLAGGSGDGRYRVQVIFPTYSPRHNANGISEMATTGTYGQDVVPIPDSFDDRWLRDHDYFPFVLGAYADSGAVDLAPVMLDAGQRTGPTRFGGEVSSASIPVEFTIDGEADAVELRFAVRLAPPDLAPIAPDGQSFPATDAGDAAGAGSFFPGPGPIFVGYEVGKPTGVATVPIRVDRQKCDSDAECLPGEYCAGEDGECVEPCVDDSNCPADEICEDGFCEEPPPPCVGDPDCNGEICVGGHCVPPCVDECSGDPEFCDRDPCFPDDGQPPCIHDEQCPPGEVCEDGSCDEPEPPCDASCPGAEICEDGYCYPPDDPCDDSSDCPGGEICAGGHCEHGDPPCSGPDCAPCDGDNDCPGGELCVGGVCVHGDPPVVCADDLDCPSGQTCEAGYCDGPDSPCEPTGECYPGEFCEDGTDTCVPEHPPIPCDTVDDCPSGDLCVGGYCQPPGDSCKNNNQCGADDVCNNGTCQPPRSPCDDGSDCSTGICQGGFCQPPHVPVPCTTTQDCPSGSECTGGYCEPPQGCTVDGDCPGGELCDDGACHPGQPPTPCTVDTDCPPGTDDVYPETCFGGFCTPNPGGCTADGDCPGGFGCTDGLCTPLGEPQPCVTVFDCGGGQVCSGGFCEPGEAETCVTADDCPRNPNDDVGAACIGGVCSTQANAITHCTSSADCAPGFGCAGGECAEIPGACQLDGDCAEGACIAGWCGTACAESSSCGSGQVCTGGRCAASCRTYGDCGEYETCLDGGCVPLPSPGRGTGGDQSGWDVSPMSELGGGCSVSERSRGGGGVGWLLAVAAALVIGPFAGRRRGWRAALLAGALLAPSCKFSGDSDGSADPSDELPPDAAPAADGNDSAVSSPYVLVSCQADEVPPGNAGESVSLDAGVDADASGGASDAAPASSDAAVPSALDTPCCAPDGLCGGDMACVEGPSAEIHRCRPRCDLATRICPVGVCANFAGQGVCIPAAKLGESCAPELCEADGVCVGESADAAVCTRRCASSDECGAGESCTQLIGSTAKACLAGSY